MQNITSSAELKNAILLLEAEKSFKEQQLIDQLKLVYQSLKPINVFRKALKELFSPPDLSENILGTVTGLASGFLSNKILVGSSGNIFKRLLGSLMQTAVRNVVASHSDEIKSFSQLILKYIRQRKEARSIKNAEKEF